MTQNDVIQDILREGKPTWYMQKEAKRLRQEAEEIQKKEAEGNNPRFKRKKIPRRWFKKGGQRLRLPGDPDL